MKMQIAFRESSEIRHGHSVVMAGGVLEVGPDEWVDFDEKTQAFQFHFIPGVDHPVGAKFVGGARPVKDPWGEVQQELATGTIEGLLLAQIERAVPNEFVNADFVFRLTALPASVEDGRVFAFSGLLHLRPGQELDFGKLLWFEAPEHSSKRDMLLAGRSGIERRPQLGEVDITERMRGNGMDQLLKLPLWGFGEEAYALPGTMSLEMYTKLDRYHELLFARSLSDDETTELDDLREIMRPAGLNMIERDEVFREYCREMRHAHPEFRAHHPLTADQIVSREESARVLIASLLDRDEARFG